MKQVIRQVVRIAQTVHLHRVVVNKNVYRVTFVTVQEFVPFVMVLEELLLQPAVVLLPVEGVMVQSSAFTVEVPE